MNGRQTRFHRVKNGAGQQGIRGTPMTTTSLIAEAVKYQEHIQSARERIAVSEHVEKHYRQIALPALAAATRRIAARRLAAKQTTNDIALRLSETGA
jgi:hypothetical protein